MTNQCLVVLVELGIIALDGSSNVIASLKFDNAAKSNQLIRTGKTPDDFGELLNKIRDIDEVKVNDQRLNGILISSGLNSQMMTTEELEEIQRGKQALLIHSGFASDERDVIRRLRDFAIEMSSEKVKEESTRLDLHVAQAINALDETDQILNTVGARMREWYGLHFPELDNLVSSLTTYAEIIRKAGSREDVTKEILVSIGIEDRKADIIISACKRSRGGI
ncbi:ribonucleotide-diphosphate reductase subunit beta, partial [Nitrososphaera sp. AFS]